MDNEVDAGQAIWLLMTLDRRIAGPIWKEAKGNLLARLPRTARAAGRAIRFFHDREELPQIEVALAETQKFDTAIWFDALACVAPEAAMQHFSRLSGGALWGTGHWWLSGLQRRVGARTNARLVTSSIEVIGAERAAAELAMLYSGQQDLLDPETFDWLIDSYEAVLVAAEKIGDTTTTARNMRALIASVASPALLLRLSARRGSHFEGVLSRAAIAREGRTSRVADWEGEEYRLILGAIGGKGYDDLILAELDRPNIQARTDGVTASTWTTSPEIKARLERLAETPLEDTYDQIKLMHALAAHRGDAALRAMVRGGSPVFLQSVRIRDDGPPWKDEDLSHISQLLDSGQLNERLHGIELCGFLSSEAAGILLAPILEGDASMEEEVSLARGVLFHLGYYRPTFLRRLEKQMLRDRGSSTANYLAWYGDADARAAVGKWLADHPLTELKSSELPIAFGLLQHPDSAQEGRAFLKRLWRRGFSLGWDGEILSVLAEAGDSDVITTLDAVAYQKPRMGAASVVAAIRTLQKTSPEEALAAAERFYRRTRDRNATQLLLELDAQAGMDILLDDYAAASVPLCYQIGRSLRCAAPRASLVDRLERMSRSGASEQRTAAAELAGWLPFEEPITFLDLLVDDESEEVEKAALTALRQRQADADCAELMKSLIEQPKPRQWAWLHAVIQTGDPAHLTNRSDPRAIHDLLDAIGDEFREEAKKLLEDRERKLGQKADQLERDRNR